MRKNKRSSIYQNQQNQYPYQYKSANSYAPNAAAYRSQVESRMSTKKRATIIVVVSLLVILIGASTAFALYMNYIGNNLNRGDKSDTELAALDEVLGQYDTSLDKPFYMMLIGSDKRANERGNARSDTNIVCRVDPIEYTVTMLSIPRDTKIDIKGHGTQKFNAAYAFDGAAGAIREAENLLGVDITHYAEVNFLDLAGLVDAVGGITVENESRIDNRKCDDGNGNHYIIEEGVVNLNGGEALTFARNRDYPDGDFRRQKHQRQVVDAIVEKVLSLNITQIPGVIEAATKCVTTDFNVMDIIGLAQNFASAPEDLIIYSGMLPSYTQMINGISFVINDEEKTEEILVLFKQGKDIADIVSNKSAAPAINSNSVDTSNTLLFDDDNEPATSYDPNTGSNNQGGSSGGTSGGSSGGSSGGDSGTTTTPDPGSTPTNPGDGEGGSSSGGSETTDQTGT